MSSCVHNHECLVKCALLFMLMIIFRYFENLKKHFADFLFQILRNFFSRDELKHYDEDIGEVLAPAPPDGGWGWVVCAASFVCNMILDGIAYSFGVLLGPLTR